MKALCCVVLAAALSWTAIPQFSTPLVVQASGDTLVVQLISDPCLVDWNGDGKHDLIVGQFTEGKVRFYPNSGTNQNPVFTTFTYLQADGADITTTYG